MRAASYPPFIRRFLVCLRVKPKESGVFITMAMAFADFLAIQGVPSAAVNFEQNPSFAGIRERKRYCYSLTSKR